MDKAQGDESQETEQEHPSKVIVTADDELIDIFTDYIPIMGMYIAGTYYALKFIRRKK